MLKRLKLRKSSFNEGFAERSTYHKHPSNPSSNSPTKLQALFSSTLDSEKKSKFLFLEQYLYKQQCLHFERHIVMPPTKSDQMDFDDVTSIDQHQSVLITISFQQQIAISLHQIWTRIHRNKQRQKQNKNTAMTTIVRGRESLLLLLMNFEYKKINSGNFPREIFHMIFSITKSYLSDSNLELIAVKVRS